MKKIAKNLMLSLLLVVIVIGNFSGCSLFQVNYYDFYNAIVATVGNQSITRFDLIESFNDYGYSYYVESLSYSIEDALEATLYAEIDKMAILQYAEENITLSTADHNAIWEDVYSYFDSAFEYYEEKAATKLNIDISPSIDDSVTEDDSTVFEGYEKTAKIVMIDGSDIDDYNLPTASYVIKFITEDSLTDESEGNRGYADYTTNITNEDVYELAKELYADDLIESYQYILDENGKSYSTDIDEVLAREFEKTYQTQYEYYMMEQLESYYASNAVLDASALVKKYQALVEESYALYSNDTTAYDSVMIGESATPESVYYHPNNDYYYLNHILIGFSDEQTALLESYNTKFISDPTYTNYETDVQSLYDSITTEDGLSASEVLSSLNYALYNSSDKALTFNDYIYKYNTDPGMFNADTPYIDSVDNTSMVTSFNEAGAELYDEGNGVVGTISGLVQSEYGYHIIYYAGNVSKSAIDYSDLYNINITDLDDIILNQATKKTLFDEMFDLIYPAETSDYGDYLYGYTDFENIALADTIATLDYEVFTSVLESSDKLLY